ncbi:unnamed protein product [Callosobruchus maculatus]|uniref:DNA endonuclease activator Ctp1 C-terminal domain-containing protein n=1 Tax=Callosobruchus maculatus TaxID=64391 RepID=A0A653BZS6_CALMS|nr:unnamed protein product [Callosobruchus maculatus]
MEYKIKVFIYSDCNSLSYKIIFSENINVHTGNREPNSTLDSPDLFKVIDQNISNSSSTIIDLSLSDDSLAITKTDCSPPLNKRKKQYKHCKITKPANSHVQEGMRFPRDISFDAEESVIAGTPEVSSNKETSKTQRKVRKKRNTTLTQIFRRVSDNQHLMDTDDGNDSDETRIDDRATQGLTELLNCINDNKTDAADIQRENDPLLRSAVFNDSDIASPRNDAFSNAALFNDSDIASPQGIPNKKQKVEAEPIVRGKARALLAGFSCQQCQDFYGKMNLSPEELKEKIDACSRHRYMYKPPPDTLPGFWDLTVTSQEDENKDH